MINLSPRYFKYFQDYTFSKLSLREYLFNLLKTNDPDLVENKIMECNDEWKIIMKSEDSNYYEIISVFYEEIFNLTYRSSKYKLII